MHQVLSQALDSQVQYAMEMTTVDGTGTAASLGPDVPIIGKTGTTTNSKSAFFIGAIPQWSLAVGIFTEQQNPNSPETLTALGGGGFGGTWPAAIWHTFMSEEFGNLPVQQFLNPIFTGEKWNQVGNVPAKKKPKPSRAATFQRPTGFGCRHRRRYGSPTGLRPAFPTGSRPTRRLRLARRPHLAEVAAARRRRWRRRRVTDRRFRGSCRLTDPVAEPADVVGEPRLRRLAGRRRACRPHHVEQRRGVDGARVEVRVPVGARVELVP